jgi:hypothetical protein
MHHKSSRLAVSLSTSAVIVAVGAAACRTAYAGPAPQVAYAHVLGNGTLDAANSLGVVTIGGGTGQYCFKLAFRARNAVATLANDPTAPSRGVGFIKVAVPPTPMFTCANIAKPDAIVETDGATSVNGGEAAGGYAFYVYWTR